MSALKKIYPLPLMELFACWCAGEAGGGGGVVLVTSSAPLTAPQLPDSPPNNSSSSSIRAYCCNSLEVQLILCWFAQQLTTTPHPPPHVIRQQCTITQTPLVTSEFRYHLSAEAESRVSKCSNQCKQTVFYKLFIVILTKGELCKKN